MTLDLGGVNARLNRLEQGQSKLRERIARLEGVTAAPTKSHSNRSKTVKGKVKRDKDDRAGAEYNWTFDFNGVPTADLMTYATKTLVIQAQSNYRSRAKNNPALAKEMLTKTFKVKDDFVTHQKGLPKSTMDKSKAIIQGASAAELDQIEELLKDRKTHLERR